MKLLTLTVSVVVELEDSETGPDVETFRRSSEELAETRVRAWFPPHRRATSHATAKVHPHPYAKTQEIPHPPKGVVAGS